MQESAFYNFEDLYLFSFKKPILQERVLNNNIKIKHIYNTMEDEIQNYIDVILDMDFTDYKIDLCFTAVYYYLHNDHNNAVEINERYKMKQELQNAIKIYPEISNVTWEEFVDNKNIYNVFTKNFFKAFCKWRERNWFGITDSMIKDIENMMNICYCDLTY